MKLISLFFIASPLLIACNGGEDVVTSFTFNTRDDTKAQRIAQDYLVAIENKDGSKLNSLFTDDIAYELQFPATGPAPTLPTAPQPVVYKGRVPVVEYFQNGFNVFGNIQHDDVKIDVSANGSIAWVRYRQRAGVPWAGQTVYYNIVVERLALVDDRISDIQLFENPEVIRAVPPPPAAATLGSR